MSKYTYDNPYKVYANIGGERFLAEYIEDDASKWFSDYLNNRNKLEKLWDAITTLFYRLKHIIKDAYWEVRYGFQRMFKGYDSVDCFETYNKFIERYSKILKRLRNNHYGYPADFKNSQEWDDILDEMIKHLYFMNEDNVEKELSEGALDGLTPSLLTIQEVKERHKEKFFELFSEYFFNLWD